MDQITTKVVVGGEDDGRVIELKLFKPGPKDPGFLKRQHLFLQLQNNLAEAKKAIDKGEDISTVMSLNLRIIVSYVDFIMNYVDRSSGITKDQVREAILELSEEEVAALSQSLIAEKN